MRKYLRQIAKARMKVLGVGNINQKMSRRNEEGLPMWRAFITGEYSKAGRDAQIGSANRNESRNIKRTIKKLGRETA